MRLARWGCRGSLGSRGSVRHVGRLALSGLGGFFGESLGAIIWVPTPLPPHSRVPSVGPPGSGRVGGPARLHSMVRALGLAVAPTIDVFGHEKGINYIAA